MISFFNAKSLLFSYSIMLLLIKLVNPTMYLLPILHMKKKCLTKIRLSLFKSIHVLERRVAYTMAHKWGWENYFHELGLSNHSRNMRIHPHWLRISIIRNRNGEEVVFVHPSHLLLHNDCKSPWIKSILMIILNKNFLYCYTVTLNYELKIDDKFRKLLPQQPSHTQKKKNKKNFFVCSWALSRKWKIENTERKDFKTIVIWANIKTRVNLGNNDDGSETSHIFI